MTVSRNFRRRGRGCESTTDQPSRETYFHSVQTYFLLVGRPEESPGAMAAPSDRSCRRNACFSARRKTWPRGAWAERFKDRSRRGQTCTRFLSSFHLQGCRVARL